MTEITLYKTVGAIAAELPGAAEIFRRHGISFCCGGDVPLELPMQIEIECDLVEARVFLR